MKILKRVCLSAFALIMICFSAVSLTACKNKSIVGTWTISEVIDTEESKSYKSGDTAFENFSEMKFEFKNDKTVTFVTADDDDAISGTWEEKDGKFVATLVDGSDSIVYTITLDDKTISFEDEELKFVFTKA